MPDYQQFPPTLTPTLGLAYTGDEMANSNLRKIDAAFAKLGLTPPEIVPDPEVKTEEAKAEPEEHHKKTRHHHDE